MKSEEETSLLRVDSARYERSSSSDTCVSRRTAIVGLLTLSFLGATIAYLKPLVSEKTTSVASMTTHLDQNAFGGVTTYQTGHNSDGEINFLDRHVFDCRGSPINGFYMIQHVNFEYWCSNPASGVVPTATYGYNTGYQNYGGVVYLDRQHLMCPEKTLLNYFHAVTGYWWWGSQMTFDYQCSSYNVKNYQCTDKYTDWNDPGPGNTLIYLDRHNVDCGPGNIGMKGWEGQTGCFGWFCSQKFRYHYTCCGASELDPTPAPIAAPTKKPIATPTFVPTLKPTAEPSFRPSYQPVADPTATPVSDPTAKPSDQPTKEPTSEPNADPTPIPTLAPISNPTKEPISSPTMVPTLMPLSDPTKEPVSTPTMAPSLEPTAAITIEPTLSPVTHPSQLPTLEPTGSPVLGSNQPSNEPVAHPSYQPSKEPTREPFSEPTRDPTLTPTPKPSYEPTEEPTHQPTYVPTIKPTWEPTWEPTHQPTFEPSAKPSFEPSMDPTLAPTQTPTVKPSNEPTKEPTYVPSPRPSLEPTYEPSKHPSPSPTYEPSTEPTLAPMSKPTPEPSIEPTNGPTHEPTLSPQMPPTSMTQAEIDAFLAQANAPPVIPNPPSAPVVILAPEEGNDDVPSSPPPNPLAVEVAKEKEVASAVANASSTGADVNAAAEEAAYTPVSAPEYANASPAAQSKTQYCSFTFVSIGDTSNVVPKGCILLADKNLDLLAAGQSSAALYICSIDPAPVKVDAAKLQELRMIDPSGNSIISFIQPGPSTKLTWFISDKFSGNSVTYMPGWHPRLTQVHMPGSVRGNDAVLSVILKSTAASVSMPTACSPSS